MNPQTSKETIESHTSPEIGNIYRCARIEREWLNDSTMPANYAITLLHSTLFNGVLDYSKKGIVPRKPGDYRLEDITVGVEPANFYVRGTDIKFVMRDYAKRLEEIIQSIPAAPSGHIDSIISNAAWAYYTFIRIHPFLDGNGRVGRMILQRVLKGAGFKDITFSATPSKITRREVDSREKHLSAMMQVDKTGNLVPLEVYIAEQLVARYSSPQEKSIKDELGNYIIQKQRENQNQKERLPISKIWQVFGNVDILGNETL